MDLNYCLIRNPKTVYCKALVGNTLGALMPMQLALCIFG